MQYQYIIVGVPLQGSALLRTGACSSGAPAAIYRYSDRWLCRSVLCPSLCDNPRLGLPLWWQGKLVPEAWDRARREIAKQGWSSRPSLPDSVWALDPTIKGVLMLANELVQRGLGDEVFTLAQE